MIEQELYTYIDNNITQHVDFGKINPDYNPRDEVIVNFFKLPSLSAQITPSFLDNFQISIRGPQISNVTALANEIMGLFQLHTLVLGNYRVWVNNIEHLGVLYEEEDVVHIPLNLSVKYTGL